MPVHQAPFWLARLQQAPDAIPTDADRPSTALFDAQHQPIGTREAWAERRLEMLGLWRRFLGSIATPADPPRPTVLEQELLDNGSIVRQLVRYEVEPGLPVEAYLLKPSGHADARARPGAVVLHSTVDSTIRQPAGLAGPADLHIAVHLARRGYVAICPRNFLWQYGRPGRLDEAVTWLSVRHPGITGMAKMLFDSVRALDLLAAQPDVDYERLCAIGHSLGAKEVLYLAAFDSRIRAAVFSEGGIGLSYSNWDAPWYLGEVIRRPGFALDHAQLLPSVAPRAFLLIGGDSADGARSWPYVAASMPVWNLLGEPRAVGFMNHQQGHAFPPVAQTQAYEWIDWFLRPKPAGAIAPPIK